ncbi:ABC transporter ATP-binding protein [Salmonella enterica subsp. salamae]|uniref:ABC transporter ATP-binding protein n=1 Tax=Salmonella enterica subsp. salamae TaxID=59202 RepID=A0A5Y3V071_SALER|nr:ABC transporter ATP-binding protein [Salmonella enterica subsp. salamae]EDK4684830.1 ABC transporter ATP-binding protein [Salmonella enterica]EDS1445365.1 ABC transporter ATP-binding protein [Salmonella enterica subsp. enterica serovar Enteritidis]ECI3454303.1 ABC transporter ATP-binding protein [Salmonella enterica subsp. salamae]ECJ2327141.1 ABC transporter ATP-binding protein [Salmonella enterica subsp. salamae]
MIEVSNLTFAFKGRIPTFENISFSLPEGEIMCILGPNGVGKTTLLKTITGLYQPVGGTCHVGRIGSRKARLTYVPQARNIHFSYSVLDFVSFGCPLRGGILPSPGSKDFELSAQMLADLGVLYLESKNINQISGGELQMCYIARALVSEPDIIVLDEPESNLDFSNQARIIKLLHQLSREKNVTIILNTHFINHANSIADKCLLMSRNGYLFDDTEVVLQEERLGEYFDVPVKRCRFEHRGVQEESFVIAL